MLSMLSLSAQNVGINNDGSKPDPHAMLDIKSADKGLLIPRMTSEERFRIVNTKGLIVYDITTDHFWYNTGREWKCIPNIGEKEKQDSAWLIGGNSNINDSTSFLGTTNLEPINFRINNITAGRIEYGSACTFLGYQAGAGNIHFGITGFGYQSLAANAGYGNVAMGYQSMQLNTTGFYNSAFGYQALGNNTDGYFNTAVGYQCMAQANGQVNTAVGYQALFNNQSSECVAVGNGALYGNTGGPSNTALGFGTMASNTTGGFNTATGNGAMSGNTNGSYNTAAGFYALNANSTGVNNSVFGNQAMQFNSSGSSNAAEGYYALYNNSIGNFNVGEGAWALFHNTTGGNNSALGWGADVSSGDLSNATAIGASAIVDASNKVRIGNSAVTVIEGQVPFTTPSDGRYKYNVQEDVKGLDFILQLRPITYQFDVRRFDQGRQVTISAAAYDEASSIRRTGFIAQEVERAAIACGYNFSGIIKPKTDAAHYSLSYDAFVVPLVKAVQEQQALIRKQAQQLESQDARLARLEQELEELKKHDRESSSLQK